MYTVSQNWAVSQGKHGTLLPNNYGHDNGPRFNALIVTRGVLMSVMSNEWYAGYVLHGSLIFLIRIGRVEIIY